MRVLKKIGVVLKETFTTTESKGPTTENKGPKRILVIDDSKIYRKILEEILIQAGYEVILASDGKEGLERFYKDPTDLVITDMVMPEKMGIDVIVELKETYPDLKIIAVSAGGDFGPEIELDMARELKAHTIQKPFDPDRVLQMVAKLLSE
jgi:DNA-binding NtrC family response regulator